MPQIPMQKLNIVASREYQEGILRFLQERALMQVVDLEGDVKKTLAKISEEERHDFDFLLAEVQFAIDFLGRHKIKEKQSFLKRLLAPAQALTPEQFDKVVKTFYFKDVIEKCKNLEEKINLLSAQEDKLREERKLLKDWKALDIPLVELKETEKTGITLGEIPEKSFEEFRKEIVKLNLVHFKEISRKKNTIKLVVVVGKEEQEKLEKILGKYEFQEVILPERKDTAEERLAEIKIQIKVLANKIKLQEQEAAKFARHIPKLQVIYDYLLWGKASQNIQEKIGNTASAFVLSGWIVEENFKALKKGLEKITKGKVEVLGVKPKEGEFVPVVIKNRSLIRPLESVTNIYGLPLPHEVDPTPFLAPFFILFFGLCLSDAGYGIVAAALAWIAITLLKVPRENQGLFRVLIYGGIAAFFVGALFGGWFGIDIEILPGFLSQFLVKVRQIDPIKNPVLILVLSLALGVVQMWVGIAVDMYWKVRQKKLKEAFLGPFPWLYFFAALIFWALCNFGMLSESLVQPAYYAMLAGVGGLVLTQGYKQKNIFMKLASGIMSLYGLVGYLSDILSYARLLALCLSTAVIAMVVNLIAVLFKDMIPVFGWVIMILVLIGGHLFNLAISGLSGFIHSARLQYVEFFSKFMEGGGEKFEPFRREHRYVNIKS